MTSRKKDDKAKALEEQEGRRRQDELRMFLGSLPDTSHGDRSEFTALLDDRLEQAKFKLPAPLRKAVLAALSERDEEAAICRDKDGSPEPDPGLRDYENVPLGEGVHDFFEHEVKPYVQDAWINEAVRDGKDGELGKVGYEINFNRHFYVYEPPRPLEEIRAEIRALEKEIIDVLGEVMG